MAKVIGLVNLHSAVNYKGLTERRPVASVSFLGRYSVIDFVLSNMSNSEIASVGILIQEKPRSLFRHLGSGKEWNFNLKHGGVQSLYNEKYANNPKYNHDINNIVENIWYLKNNKSDYIVIAPAHIVTTMDYREAIDAHAKSGSEVTMVYKKINDADTSFIGSDRLELEGKRVVALKKNRGNKKDRNIFLETYIINYSVFMKLLDYAGGLSSFFSLRDTISYLLDEMVIDSYEYKGYARCLDSIENYMKYSLEIVDFSMSSQVFKSNWPIFTRTNDTPPAKYETGSRVTNSFVSNGAIISGEVNHSIIGRNVTVGKGAVVKNSIIFTGTKIADGAYLENVIVDKDAKIYKVKELIGETGNPLFVKEGDEV